MASGDDQTPSGFRIRTLSEADAQALDALLAIRRSGTTGPMPADAGERAEQLTRLLSLLEALPDGEDQTDGDDLVRRTCQRVRTARQRERFASQVQQLTGDGNGRGAGIGWREIGSTAAILLLTLSLLVPVVSRQRVESRRLACQANLGQAYRGFATYAADHRGQLPRAAVQPGVPWFIVGQSTEDGPVRSNSANLYLLVRGQYLQAHDLACPANPDAPPRGALTARHRDWPRAESVSYSYQNQYTPEPARLETHAGLALLADKNPLFAPSDHSVRFDRAMPAAAASRLHRGMGQNVLTADGRVTWTVQPIIITRDTRRPDNIWTITGVSDYQGTEFPDSPDDSFLVP